MIQTESPLKKTLAESSVHYIASFMVTK